MTTRGWVRSDVEYSSTDGGIQCGGRGGERLATQVGNLSEAGPPLGCTRLHRAAEAVEAASEPGSPSAVGQARACFSHFELLLILGRACFGVGNVTFAKFFGQMP